MRDATCRRNPKLPPPVRTEINEDQMSRADREVNEDVLPLCSGFDNMLGNESGIVLVSG